MKASPVSTDEGVGVGPRYSTDLREASVNGSVNALRQQVFYDGASRCAIPSIAAGARLLAFVTGLANQELLLQNEYLAWENRILKAHLPTGL